MTQKDAIDYFAECPFAELRETANIAAAILKTRERYEAAQPPAPRRGRPPKNKTVEAS